ncbi:MAG TPA: HlyD family efflux transporter periplasmic adaptor subunit, partial [Polyangiaceae bacterium]|nr:HlyD family efflux transporter periplasmic adaptor subunit [Polyangiaceae bacterium]
QAEGQLQQAQAALERVASKSLPTARRAEIEAAQARLQAEQAQLAKAKLDHDRQQQLFNGGAVAKGELDNADIALRNASAQVNAQRAVLDQLLQGTPQDVKAADGQVAVAKGRLEQIDVMISELTIRSPVRARVESLDLRPGDILPPNAAAAKLLEPDQLYVRIYIPETELGHVRLRQEVPIYVDSFPGKAFKGVVEYVASEGEYSPRNLQTADERADQVFAARIGILEGKDQLRAGMAAQISVPK